MISFTIRNINKFFADLEKEHRHFVRTAFDVVRVEGYRQKKKLQEEIKAGSPGGAPFKPLTWLAKIMRERKYGHYVPSGGSTREVLGKTANWPPLYRTFHGIRYNVTYPYQNSMNFAFGFGTPQTSVQWKRLARMQQEGFTAPVTNKMRMDFAMKAGIALSSRTTQLVTPARDIITPFWERHQSEMWRNIRDNFEIKSRGEWITSA